MANMSHCRFRNTVGDLSDCLENLYEELPEDEARARKQLIKLAYEIVNDFLTGNRLDMEAVNDLPVEREYEADKEDRQDDDAPAQSFGWEGPALPEGDVLAARLLGVAHDYPGGAHKINLIKAWRIVLGDGLREAKDGVERLFDFSTGIPVIK